MRLCRNHRRNTVVGVNRMITLHSDSTLPPYEQIRAQLAAQINDRTLPVGTQLPTVRRLADDLALAVNTVARAYRELEAAGLVETRGRAGTVVRTSDPALERVHAAAASYATLVRSTGLGTEEALQLVRTALEPAGSPA
jgi:DNA-binding transcriptional regulator YhcF (GntR family)